MHVQHAQWQYRTKTSCRGRCWPGLLGTKPARFRQPNSRTEAQTCKRETSTQPGCRQHCQQQLSKPITLYWKAGELESWKAGKLGRAWQVAVAGLKWVQGCSLKLVLKLLLLLSIPPVIFIQIVL